MSLDDDARRRRFSDGLALLLVVAAVTVPCWAVIFGDSTFWFRDVSFLYLDQKQLVAREMLEGRLPWWDGRLHGGVPLWANPNNLTAHPSTLLTLVMSVERALGVSTALAFAAGAAGCFLLGGQLDLERGAAAVAGIAFAMSGTLVSLTAVHPHFLALAPLPLLVACWNAWLRGGSSRWLAGVAGVAATAALAGGPEEGIVGILTMIAWTAAVPSTRRPFMRLAALLGCGAIALAVAAPLWVPAVEAAAASMRAKLSWDAVMAFPLHPQRLLEIVVPGMMGSPLGTNDAIYWGARLDDGNVPYLHVISIGPVITVLAAWGVLPGSPLALRLRGILVALVAIALLVAMTPALPGVETFADALTRLPLRYPSKALELATLPIALLAAAGAERARTAGGRIGVSALLLAAALGGCAAAALAGGETTLHLASGLLLRDAHVALRGIASALAGAALTSLALGLVLLMLRGPRLERVAGPMLAVLATASLLPQALVAAPTAPVALMSPDSPAAQAILGMLGGQRLLRLHGDLGHSLLERGDGLVDTVDNQRMLRRIAARRYGIPLVLHVDFDHLAPERLATLGLHLYSIPWERRLPAMRSAGVGALLVDVSDLTDAEWHGLAGAREVGDFTSPEGPRVRLFAIDRPVPTARFIPTVRLVGSDAEALAAVTDPSHDPSRQVIIVGGGRAPSQPDCASRVSPPALSLHDDQVIAVEAACPGVLVLAIPFQSGIEVFVDGARAAIVPADVAFVGVPLSEGRHDVRWRWRPWGWHASLVACALGLVALLALAGRKKGVGFL